MKSLMLFLESVLIDLGTWCCTSTILDQKRIKDRFEHEGLSFLTITLADFGKDFERSLDLGSVGHDSFLSFKKRGGLPQFLGGFLDQVFDRGTGRLLDEPSVTAIWAIRQLTLMFAKINLPCTSARERAAIRKYIECEDDVRAADEKLISDVYRRENFSRLSTLLWGSVLSKVDSDVYYDRIVPTHGPGATADRRRGNAKWNQSAWTDRLEEVFPSWVHLTSSELLSIEKLDHVDIIEPETEIPVRVITVPKTLKTPRIIAIEPTCMQYMQQGIFRSLTEAIEADDIASSFIGYLSQIPNQDLALKGSRDGSLATLDLSEASDRVSNLHVQDLTRNHPNLAIGIDACRSRKADVDGYGVIPLAKFASMGSALTFPMEAMVFCTVVFLGIERALNRQLTLKELASFKGQVRVYGDDIIIPADFVRHVVDELEAYGFKVNTSKSFWNGKFRESCGKEYYEGEDVSIVRLRSTFPTRRAHASEIISTISTRNQLYKAGLWQTAWFLDNMLERLIPFPTVAETSPIRGKFSFLGYSTENSRICPDLQRPLVKGVVVSSRIPMSPLDDYGALLKVLSKPSDLPFADENHLKRAGRPVSVDIKIRWSSPY